MGLMASGEPLRDLAPNLGALDRLETLNNFGWKKLLCCCIAVSCWFMVRDGVILDVLFLEYT